MIITIYTLNFNSVHPTDAPFNVSFKPHDPQKATIFIGAPQDRRLQSDTMRQWKVEIPETASMQGDELMWFDDGEIRLLTAVEVYSLAVKGENGFRIVDA